MVYLVVFTLVWAESAIFAGFVIPGESGLIVGGVLAGLGRVDVVALAACGVAGAVIGDSVEFEVGRHFGPRVWASTSRRRTGAGLSGSCPATVAVRCSLAAGSASAGPWS